MRQRNDTPYPWTFAAQPAVPATDDIPEQPETDMFVVNPGEAADRPTLLDGWTALDEHETAADDSSDSSGADVPSPAEVGLKAIRSRRIAAADSDKTQDGGELR